MIAFTFLVNILFVIVQSRRRYRGGGGGRAGAGVGRVTQTFGKGVATLIKDIKQGNWGEQESAPQYDQKRGVRDVNQRKYYQSIGNDTTFYVLVAIGTILLVAAILYYIIVVQPKMQQKNTKQQMKKRHAQRYKNYEAIKMISQTGIHPDKAFGRLQRIKYK